MQKTMVEILLERNALSPILNEFNQTVVNGSTSINQFFIKHVLPRAPGVSKVAFYKMIKDYSGAGKKELVPVYDSNNKLIGLEKIPLSPSMVAEEAYRLKKSEQKELDPAKATSRGIEAALKIGTTTLEAIANDPAQLMLLSVKDRTDLLFKAMRAQDARVNVAINARREVRAHKAFQHAFDEAAYQVEDMVAQDALPMEQQ